ncbi:ATP-binding protein [Micromonospora inositola]|uniref:Anti-sigma regulatory factor (Ser/Thr protein kinase) n=1 Tax=Micromonospora inositola TaxID=47865 RepID=A0A1C5HFU6_9ACTN|nr:ATP-binding protein [Micromonospora inositola]SCG44882.1 Anti-sigma regulatory factor (Ser/Thr protein kinase) [Micromonospora inositola]
MGQLHTSPPPPQATELERWNLGNGAELRELRASLRAALTRYGLTQGEELDEVPGLVVLVATELASNALRHGIPPTIVTLLAADDCFILDVADRDLTTVPELADTQPLDSGGRGLLLAQSVSLAVGWYATPDTKNIWASFPRSP